MTSPFGVAPAGTDLSASTTAGNNAAVVVLMVIASTAVILRLISRKIQRINLEADDYLCITALVFVYATASLSIAGGFHGSGKHVWIVAKPDVRIIVKILYAYTFIYAASVSFTKLSIIFFYYRIFGKTSATFNKCLYICGFLSCGYAIMIWGTMIGGCRPITYFWNQYFDPTAVGSCVRINYFFLIAGAINMVIDVIILTLPIPKILKLQMSHRRKLSIIGIMLLGSFVCAASIVRITYLVTLQTDVDLTWIMGPVFIWSSVEPAIGILSACLPTLGPLLRVLVHEVTSTNRSGRSRDATVSGGWRNINDRNNEATSKSFDQVELKHNGKFEGVLRPEDDQIGLTHKTWIVASDSRSTNTRDEDYNAPQAIRVRTEVDVD